MDKTVSATQARIHFGEIMRQARQGPVIVERDGKPEVVVLSKQAYDKLLAAGQRPAWQELLSDVHQRVRMETASRPLPPPEPVLNDLRKERDDANDPLR